MMTMTTESCKALVGTQLGAKVKKAKPKKRAGKYPQRTRPARPPQRNR